MTSGRPDWIATLDSGEGFEILLLARVKLEVTRAGKVKVRVWSNYHAKKWVDNGAEEREDTNGE